MPLLAIFTLLLSSIVYDVHGKSSASAPHTRANLAPVVIPAQPSPFFSWDRIPTAFHGANKTGRYTDDAVADLAKYQMITIEKWYTPCASQGPVQGGPSCDVEAKIETLLRRVRAINPRNITTNLYLNSMFDFAFYQLHGAMLALEARGVPAFLRDQTGHVVELCNDGDMYCNITTFDWTQPPVRALWMQAIANATATGVVDGIFADHSAQEGIQIGNPSRNHQGPNQLCNGVAHRGRKCFNFSTDFTASFNSWHLWATNKSQDMLAKSTGGPVICGPYAFHVNFDCKRGFDTLRKAQAKYTVIEASTRPCVPDESCVAAFLAAAGERTYLTCFSGTPSPFPEMAYPLGAPDGPATEGAGEPGVWRRTFASGTEVTWDNNKKKGSIAWGHFSRDDRSPPPPPLLATEVQGAYRWVNTTTHPPSQVHEVHYNWSLALGRQIAVQLNGEAGISTDYHHHTSTSLSHGRNKEKRVCIQRATAAVYPDLNALMANGTYVGKQQFGSNECDVWESYYNNTKLEIAALEGHGLCGLAVHGVWAAIFESSAPPLHPFLPSDFSLCNVTAKGGEDATATPSPPKFTKDPATRAVVAAGGGSGAPTFVSDPGVYADAEGLHLFASNIFCDDRNGSWYYSWDASNRGACNILNVSDAIGYAFSGDGGATWAFAPGPTLLPGPHAWDSAAVETPFPRVVNDTLYLFYSARGVGSDGKEFTSRYQLGVATVALAGRGLRRALLVDGARAAKRAAPLVSHDTAHANATTNNVQEPSAVWTGARWEVFGIGLGLSEPAQPIGAPGQRITGIYMLRWVFDDPALPAGGGALRVCTTTAPVNIIEVHRRSASDYRMYFTTLVQGSVWHHGEQIGWAQSEDGLDWAVSATPLLSPDAAGGNATFDDWGIMAPTVAVLPPHDDAAATNQRQTMVLFFSAWEVQNSPCLPVARDGRFGQPMGDRCALSNIGRAVSV